MIKILPTTTTLLLKSGTLNFEIVSMYVHGTVPGPFPQYDQEWDHHHSLLHNRSHIGYHHVELGTLPHERQALINAK